MMSVNRNGKESEMPAHRKLDDTQRSRIVKHLNDGTRTIRQLAEEYGVHRMTIRRLKPVELIRPWGSEARDLVGERFGAWTVLQRSPRDPERDGSNAFWVCLCDCGVTRRVRGSALTRGKSSRCKSCSVSLRHEQRRKSC